MPFFEQAVRRLKPGGCLGWSISNTFLRSKFGGSLREFLGKACSMQVLVEFENPKVYADAVTQIVLVQLKKSLTDERCRHVWVRGKPDLRIALECVAAGQSTDFRVALPSSSIQAEIAAMVRLLMATPIDQERMQLKNAINEAVLGIFGHSSNAEPDIPRVFVDSPPSGEIGGATASVSETGRSLEPTETT